MLLGVLPSACMSSIVMIPDAPRCLDYVPEGIWAQVPGAPMPLDDSSASWVTFGNSQTGQLAVANLKPGAIRHIIGTCEDRHAAALAKAERESKPWWRRRL
jgi:hypothetical protein